MMSRPDGSVVKLKLQKKKMNCKLCFLLLMFSSLISSCNSGENFAEGIYSPDRLKSRQRVIIDVKTRA